MDSEHNMKKIEKSDDYRHSQHRAELKEKAKLDPQLAQQLEAAKRVMEKYSETLKRLADS